MELQDVQALQTQVLWAAFAVSAAFGAIAQRTHFCTMGAISDIYNMGSWVRMRMWGMAVGVAMIGFYAMAWLGWIAPFETIYSSGRVLWLSALLGGAMFGFGMVLASGCGSKTLVRIGEGSLKSLVVFFVMGFAAYASMRGMTGLLRSRTTDLVGFDIPAGSPAPAWLSAAMGTDPLATGFSLALLVGVRGVRQPVNARRDHVVGRGQAAALEEVVAIEPDGAGPAWRGRIFEWPSRAR